MGVVKEGELSRASRAALATMPPKTRRIFTASAAPQLFKRAIPLLTSAEAARTVETATEHVVAYLCGETLTADAFDAACAACGASADDLGLIFSALLLTAQQIVREKVPMKSAEKNLKDDFQLSTDVVAAFLKPLSARLSEIEAAVEGEAPTFPQVQDLRWRVDVHISNAVLSKILKPSVLMQMVMKDGQVKTFEVSPEKFQDLRYNTAKLLREMHRMEARLDRGLKAKSKK